MALVTLGPLIAEARGKVGSMFVACTHARYRAGIATTPRNPKTAEQVTRRATLKNLVLRWGWVLNQTPQRDGWIALGLAHNWTDILGQTYHLTGIALYILVNQNLNLIGEPIMDDHPAALTCGSPNTASLAFNGGTDLLVDAGTEPVDHEHAVVSISPLCSPGVSYVGLKYRFMKHFPAAAAGPWSVLTQFLNKYGALTSGAKVNAEVNFVDDRYGWKGTPAFATGIVP